MNKYFKVGFACSVSTFILTVVLSNIVQIKELNPVLDLFLGKTYMAVMFYGLIWSLLFTIYRYYDETDQQIYVNYLSYFVFFIFSFDLLHDVISMVGWLI